MRPDLSVLIPARKEEWLSRTIDDVLAHARANTEVIAVLDGAWTDPAIADHPKVRLIYLPESIGQRAATNLAARASEAKYVMKLDAHCALDEGFDVKLIAADEELGRPDVTQIPAMLNLHVFNWKCLACGTETYQGPQPALCATCAASSAKSAGGPFERLVYWDLNAGGVPGKPRRTEFWRFDWNLHFRYSGPRIKGQEIVELADVMSSIGACFFMRRERFWQLGGLDESHGSWGQYGTEIACKSWLSGGRQIVNRRTWFAHLFRTQDGFGFPYANPGNLAERARIYSRQLWLENRWPGQVRPLAWLLEHFAPVVGWHVPSKGRDEPDNAKMRAERLALVQTAARTFPRSGGPRWNETVRDESQRSVTSMSEHQFFPTSDRSVGIVARRCPEFGMLSASSVIGRSVTGAPISRMAIGDAPGAGPPAKSLLYYSDCRGDSRILAAVREQIRRAAPSLPILAVTLDPVDFGDIRIVLPLARGQLTMFRQILTGLETIETDVVFFVEHDVLYDASHFQFTPPRRDRFYYNQHRWQVSAEDGRAAHYLCCQTAQLCADRQLLIEHYRQRIAAVEAAGGYQRHMGFEPGTNRWSRGVHPHGFKMWMSPVPNIDIRHGKNLSKTRWSPSEFRNRNSCQGWVDGDGVPGWGVTRGRFGEFLAELSRRCTSPASVSMAGASGAQLGVSP